ncbi:hypothetical protein BDR05DRAFT_1000403 [Suillus weaverae]|nr:hypothetical protein BDR05DRAFT_1000403 [Suillus weaverae]
MDMSDRDMILLGKPWLSAMNPDINWTKDTLRLPSTPRSLQLEKWFEKQWGITSTSPKTKKEEVFYDCEEEPLPALLPNPDEEPFPQLDTKEDVWDDTFARKVEDPATYSINDDEILIEYAPDGSSITLFKNLSFDSPLTQDGTSASEIWRTAAIQPLRNSWIFMRKTEEEEYLKTSNKAQEFALKDTQEKKKKTFEELVPEYLHDFTDVFAKDGLNKLPPS